MMDITFFKDSFEFLRHPSKIIVRKDKASLSEAVKLLAITGLIGGLLVSVFPATLFFLALTARNPTNDLVLCAPATILLSTVFWPVSYLITSALYFVLAKLLGGKASYGEQTYLLSLPALSALLVSYFFIAIIPFIFFIFLILSGFPMVPGLLPYTASFPLFLFILYMLYVHFVVIKDVHGLDTRRAAVAVVIPQIIITIILTASLVLLAAFILAKFLSGLSGWPNPGPGAY